MASGDKKLSNHCATGTVTGTGSAITVICNFKPKVVELNNTSGNCIGKWNDLMPDAALHKIVDSGGGTTDISYVTSAGITPLFNGFQIGTDTDLNVNTEVIFWNAYK